MISLSNSLLLKLFSSWWNIATHLSWSLLGLADQDWLDSVDVPSVFLVRLLYGFFLIMAVVLLVNMMIALLSNTYQQVQVLNRSLPSRNKFILFIIQN